MERTFFSGNTLEQAVLAAARHHGLDPERVAYTLRDKKHGFLNIRRNVVITVDPAAPERELTQPEEPQSQVPQSQEDPPSGKGSSSSAGVDRDGFRDESIAYARDHLGLGYQQG